MGIPLTRDVSMSTAAVVSTDAATAGGLGLSDHQNIQGASQLQLPATLRDAGPVAAWFVTGVRDWHNLVATIAIGMVSISRLVCPKYVCLSILHTD